MSFIGKSRNGFFLRPSIIVAASTIVALSVLTIYFVSQDSSQDGTRAGQVVPSSNESSPPLVDKFGIKQLYPSAQNGMIWSSTWNNGHARTFTNAIDPDDKWFDTDHGEGTYTIDGKGKLSATGDYVRMYVHDPALTREWSENLEITTYVTRVKETQRVSYSGLQIFARTNHGTNADETVNLCDDRGYGAKVTIDGIWSFEKETRHDGKNGYADPGGIKPGYPNGSGLPKNMTIGVKYVIRNLADGNVNLELYRDLTGGLNGGDWKKIYSFIDTGENLGVGYNVCKKGVAPELILARPITLASSESKKPELTVYFRHEYGTMTYEKTSIREILV
jgi:hypothetical protein